MGGIHIQPNQSGEVIKLACLPSEACTRSFYSSNVFSLYFHYLSYVSSQLREE